MSRLDTGVGELVGRLNYNSGASWRKLKLGVGMENWDGWRRKYLAGQGFQVQGLKMGSGMSVSSLKLNILFLCVFFGEWVFIRLSIHLFPSLLKFKNCDIQVEYTEFVKQLYMVQKETGWHERVQLLMIWRFVTWAIGKILYHLPRQGMKNRGKIRRGFNILLSKCNTYKGFRTK